ncbi:MAG: DUF1735 domain-containing protein [Chitinophagaceae bacterium]
MLKAKYFTGCLLAATVFFSCKKDEIHYDVTGDTGTSFYTNNESPGNAPLNSLNYDVLNYPDVASSGLLTLSSNVPAAIKFPVFSTKPVNENVEISAEVDNSLIAAYNEANNTSYTAFPAGVLTASNLTAHIAKGTARSADSITITSNPALLNTLSAKKYMLPIKLTTVSNPAAGALTTTSASKVAYIIVNTDLRRIKYLALAAEAQGALVTPRTSWAVTYNPAPVLTGTGSIFDASTATYVRWANVSPNQVDVNMQASKNVTGIRLYTSNSATYTPTQVDVWLSNDGVNYELIGSPLKANLTYASSYNYILFYKAIPAQYIRLKLYYSTSTNTQNFRLTEFDVYAN